MIDYSKVFPDRKRNVLLVKKMVDAAAQDHEANILFKKKWSTRRYERDLNKSYPDMDNRTAFQTAGRSAKAFSEGAKSGVSTLSGNDVYKIARFFLGNLGAYGWPKVKETIKNEGAPYSQLLRLERNAAESSEVTLESISQLKLSDIIDKKGEGVPDALRVIADYITALNAQSRENRMAREKLVKDSAAIKGKVDRLRRAVAVIVAAFEKAPENKRQELQTSLDVCKKLLKDLQ